MGFLPANPQTFHSRKALVSPRNSSAPAGPCDLHTCEKLWLQLLWALPAPTQSLTVRSPELSVRVQNYQSESKMISQSPKWSVMVQNQSQGECSLLALWQWVRALLWGYRWGVWVVSLSLSGPALMPFQHHWAIYLCKAFWKGCLILALNQNWYLNRDKWYKGVNSGYPRTKLITLLQAFFPFPLTLHLLSFSPSSWAWISPFPS